MNTGARLLTFSLRHSSVENAKSNRVTAKLFGIHRHFSTGLPLTKRKYTKRHEWISNTNGGKNEKAGVTDYAQDALGDIVFVQLPEVGIRVKRFDECGALESVKAASDVYAPLDGMVTAVNPEVESSPSLINASPYDQGWLFQFTLNDVKDFDQLMDKKQYEEFLKAEKPI